MTTIDRTQERDEARPMAERSRAAQRITGAVLVLYWAALFTATHVPLPRVGDLPAGSDKGMHFMAYAGLGGLLAAWLLLRGTSTARVWTIVLAVCLAYGAIDELLQGLIPTRSADVFDWLADAAGALAGLTVVTVLRWSWYHSRRASTSGARSMNEHHYSSALKPAERPASHSEFQRLASTWRAETAHLSSAHEMAQHPAYQQIVAMGPGAVPLILRELEREPAHWFLALQAITGADPVEPQDRGRVDAMARAWLDWGRENGYEW